MIFITKRLNEITMEVSVNREGALIQPQCSPQFKRRDKEAEVAQETEKEQTHRKNNRRCGLLKSQVLRKKKKKECCGGWGNQLCQVMLRSQVRGGLGGDFWKW